jgi:hypothetical protein
MARKRKGPRTCRECRAVVIFARVLGRSGRHVTIALDPVPADGGAVAAYRTSAGGLLGRFLAKGEEAYGYERRYAQHACPRPDAPEGERLPPAQPDLFTAMTS